MGELICPNCGSKVVLPEHSTFCAGITFSKDSNGTHYLHMENEKESNTMENTTSMNNASINTTSNNTKESKGMSRAAQRIAELQAKGIDTSNYFAINESTLIKMENGQPVVVPLDDDVKEIVNRIQESDEIFNRNLDGRFIFAGVMHMLRDDYTASLNKFNYWYQWEMLMDRNTGDGELKRICKRLQSGETGVEIDAKAKFFNGRLIGAMIDDYVEKFRDYIDSLPTHKLKGVLEYKRLGKRYERLTGHAKGDIFVDDIHSLVRKYQTLACRARTQMYETAYVGTYRTLMSIVKDFYKIVVYFPTAKYVNGKYEHIEVCNAFKDAYKGNGAFFTANNLIRFHGCRVYEHVAKYASEYPNGKKYWYTKEESLNRLATELHNDCGYQLLGFLKQLIEDNDIDVSNTRELFNR